MDIRIGINNSPRELSFESEAKAEELEKLISEAIESNKPLISLSDSKGNRYLVPTSAISYLEIGAEETRRVGFIA